MAQPNPVKPAESKPNLVSIETTPASHRSAGRGRTSRIPWILAGLAVLTFGFLYWQSLQLTEANDRILALGDQVAGLEGQLSSAQSQIQTYETERGLVRDVVSDISERMNTLREMVGVAPAAVPPEAAAASDEPVPAEVAPAL